MPLLPRLTDSQLGYLLQLCGGACTVPTIPGDLERLSALGFVAPADGLAEMTEAGRNHLRMLVDPASGSLLLNLRPF